MNLTIYKLMGIALCLLLASYVSHAGKYKIQVSASPSDAKIYVDGQLSGNGQANIIVLKNSCVNVTVIKVGYLTQQITYCNKKNAPHPPKTDFFQLSVDDAYTASLQTDIANNDISIEIDGNRSDLEAWKILSQIVMNYFDVIEVTDRETGYLRTAWVAQSFTQNTVRTRLIVKLGSTSPLVYKIKSDRRSDCERTIRKTRYECEAGPKFQRMGQDLAKV